MRRGKKSQVDAKSRCVHFLFAFPSAHLHNSSIVISADSLVAFSLRGRDKSPTEKLGLCVCFGFYFDYANILHQIGTQNTSDEAASWGK